jgi:hypothetical protein
MLWSLILSGFIMAIFSVSHFTGGAGDIFMMTYFLVSVALVWTGWRWAFLAPAVFTAFLLQGGLRADGLRPFVTPAAHWGDFEMWLVALPLMFLFLVGAVVKLVQIIRRKPLQLPAFSPYLIAVIAGFALGGNLLAIVNR